MILPVSSNLANLLYILFFEILLHYLLTLALRTLISLRNLHHLHEGFLRLNPTPFHFLLDYGLSHPPSYPPLVIGLATLSLTLIGSFSFQGFSRNVYSSVPVINHVSRARTDAEIIDFTKHISMDGKIFSATNVLTRNVMLCRNTSASREIVLESINSFQDVHSLSYTRNNAMHNSTCLSTRRNFRQVIQLSGYRLTSNPDLSHCNLVLPNTTSYRHLAYIAKRDIVINSCPFTAETVWCANFLQHVCVLQGKHLETDLSIRLFRFFPPSPRESYTLFDMTLFDNAMPAKGIKSLAYITAVDTRGGMNIGAYRNQAWTTIKMNGFVEKLSGEKAYTRVNVKLLAGTSGVALGILVCTGLLTMGLSMREKKYRRGTNAFNSATDCIEFARRMEAGSEEKENDGKIWVGIRKRDGRVGVLRRRERTLENVDLEIMEYEVNGRVAVL